jgi:hypothetical protein
MACWVWQNIGPIHKKDVIKASIMKEHKPEFATILAFDVQLTKEGADYAKELDVKARLPAPSSLPRAASGRPACCSLTDLHRAREVGCCDLHPLRLVSSRPWWVWLPL